MKINGSIWRTEERNKLNLNIFVNLKIPNQLYPLTVALSQSNLYQLNNLKYYFKVFVRNHQNCLNLQTRQGDAKPKPPYQLRVSVCVSGRLRTEDLSDLKTDCLESLSLSQLSSHAAHSSQLCRRLTVILSLSWSGDWTRILVVVEVL